LEEKPRLYPIDTLVANTLQSHLEWLGYELDYVDAGMQALPVPSEDTVGIVMDGSLHVAQQQEVILANWMNAQRLKGLKFLILGDIPFRDEVATTRWQRDFGVRGDLMPVRKLKSVKIRQVDPSLFGDEVKLVGRQHDFFRLVAPVGAKVFLSLSGTDEVGGIYRYDPIFKASWGVAQLAPYVTFDAASTHRFYYLDPYRMIEQWLGERIFPAPDVTTRMGRRLFYSHIDGDGFCMKSKRTGQPTCGELVRDNILKRYPFPVTVSVVESDIRGYAWSLNPEDAPVYEKLARSVFAMPHIEAASHSFSHPFYWAENDYDPGEYEIRFVPLHPAANYKDLSLRREIEGSISYINERLLPPGKKVQLMLWSGNCRPGEEALKITRELGIENMNGGDTTLSDMYTSLINVAPKVMQWGDELQVYASNQNEFMYANGFAGPFLGGYAKVIETFERTEKPRRLKPVNVYYHFYSTVTLSAERSLKKILDWCWTQPLHYTTATHYTQLVRDSRSATVRLLGRGHWMLSAGPHLTTWRLPLKAGVPDVGSSLGILGYKLEGDQLYIETDGRSQAELRLVEPIQGLTLEHLRLVECSGPLEISELGQHQMLFQNESTLPVKVVLGGIAKGYKCEVTSSRGGHTETSTMPVSATGELALIVLEGSQCSIKALSPLAAGR
jgi:hypothetical protein